PLGPSRTMNSPSAMASERSETASVVPKRLLTCRSVTSAMAGSLMTRGADGRPALRVEQRKPFRAEDKADRLADPDLRARRQSRRDAPVAGIDGHDLRGAAILGAEHAAAHLCRIGETDMLGAHTQYQRPCRARLAHRRHRNAGAVEVDRLVAG